MSKVCGRVQSASGQTRRIQRAATVAVVRLTSRAFQPSSRTAALGWGHARLGSVRLTRIVAAPGIISAS
ncbi:hypothetical protein ABZV28_17980 [Streptomyces sp. NPDC004981]|uniref:hypothetical protein n=1 Tax=Streptomyces sp. NPDC004981 TaxID=3156655 RepID=UPI0033AD1A21